MYNTTEIKAIVHTYLDRTFIHLDEEPYSDSILEVELDGTYIRSHTHEEFTRLQQTFTQYAHTPPKPSEDHHTIPIIISETKVGEYTSTNYVLEAHLIDGTRYTIHGASDARSYYFYSRTLRQSESSLEQFQLHLLQLAVTLRAGTEAGTEVGTDDAS